MRKFPTSKGQEKLYHSWMCCRGQITLERAASLPICACTHASSMIERGREVADALGPCARMHPAQPLHAPRKVKLKSLCASWVWLSHIARAAVAARHQRASLAACIYLPSQMHTPEMRPPHLPTGTTNQTPLHKRLFAAPKLENRPFARAECADKWKTTRSSLYTRPCIWRLYWSFLVQDGIFHTSIN